MLRKPSGMKLGFFFVESFRAASENVFPGNPGQLADVHDVGRDVHHGLFHRLAAETFGQPGVMTRSHDIFDMLQPLFSINGHCKPRSLNDVQNQHFYINIVPVRNESRHC